MVDGHTPSLEISTGEYASITDSNNTREDISTFHKHQDVVSVEASIAILGDCDFGGTERLPDRKRNNSSVVG